MYKTTMYSATLGSKHGISATVFQLPEDLDRAILTVYLRSEFISGLSTVQFFGSSEDLRKLAAVIHDAVEQLKGQEEAAPAGEFAGQNAPSGDKDL